MLIIALVPRKSDDNFVMLDHDVLIIIALTNNYAVYLTCIYKDDKILKKYTVPSLIRCSSFPCEHAVKRSFVNPVERFVFSSSQNLGPFRPDSPVRYYVA
jgi:hypothetical protein